MTQENVQNFDFSTWWEGLDFEAKQQFSCNENGEITVSSFGDYNERSIGTVPKESADNYINLLKEKFTEVSQKATELSSEWDKEEDKLKLVGKVERLKEYLKHASALGDIHSLYTVVDKYAAELKTLIEANYDKKVLLAEKAEEYATSEEWKQTTGDFKALVEEWKAIGFVDKHRSDQLWSRVEAAKDKFYERKREHNEDVNKEMLQNLDLKMEVVEKAEALAASDNWKETTQKFKDLMEEWKGIGHTMHEKNEALWLRFQAASNAFFEKKRAHFDVIQKEQEANYEAKKKLVEQADALKDNTDWNDTTKQYTALMDEWKKIGRVPKEKSDEIWGEFNAARDHFFNKKRENFQAFKLTLEDNYAQKQALLKRAESLQNSSQWRETTEELNELMTEWKKIGAVPRKHSDEIWELFISARKKFFERKDANREKRKANFEKRAKERVGQTRSFIDTLADELKEEEERLVDFKEGLENITPGMKKEAELRDHLTKLIGSTEKKIVHKKEKLEDAKKQLEELEAKEKEKEQQQV